LKTSAIEMAKSTLALLLALVIGLAAPGRADAARDTNSYDGNIFALYAGNGALVPPSLSLAAAMAAQRPILLAFYLDDSADCKRFAPLLSDLQGRWGKSVELIALPGDAVTVNPKAAANDPSHYWSGVVPQLLVLSSNGKVLFDGAGNMQGLGIETALAEATGKPIPAQPGGDQRRQQSFNEVNSELG
jgi:thiol-disulfide isomerase/thioredoxin